MKVAIIRCIVLFGFGLLACTSEKKPVGVLDKEKFAEILIDMYTGEARMNNLSIANDSAYKLFQPYEAALLEKRGVPDSVIKLTYRYYVEHPIEFEAVYDIVIDTLSLREQKAGAVKAK